MKKAYVYYRNSIISLYYIMHSELSVLSYRISRAAIPYAVVAKHETANRIRHVAHLHLSCRKLSAAHDAPPRRFFLASNKTEL